MTLTELRYIVALERERHFGRAAERCFVSQPTLSVAVKKLESDLGVTLFERQRSDIQPTPIGVRIVEQARRVLGEVEQIRAIASEGHDELSGRLRVGAIYTVGPYLLPSLIPALSQLAPAMPLVIEENYTAELARQLKRNEQDVIIVAQPFAEPGVMTWDVYEEPFVVAMPRKHPWTQRKAIPAAALAEEDLLLLGPGHCFRDQVVAACPECEHHDDTEPHTGSSLETIRHMVASGLGITVLPGTSVEREQQESSLLAIRPFEAPVPRRRIVLAWRRSFPRPAAIKALRDAILRSGLPEVEWLTQAQPQE